MVDGCVTVLRERLLAVAEVLSASVLPAAVGWVLAAPALHRAPRLAVHAVKYLGSPTTTGAPLTAAARLLRSGGALAVHGSVVTRARRRSSGAT